MTNAIPVAAKAPDSELAMAIAARIVGYPPTSVCRFTTGMAHYVFNVAFAGRCFR
jgi:hypothetical protein